MQCQSYFQGYHSHYDLNVDANGGASPSPSPMYNHNAISRSGPYNEYVVGQPLPIPRGPSLPYKELLRRTMLLQEDTFKDQVQELHRLYRRQKELMGEIKCKYMYMNHLHIDNSSSNLTSAKISVKYGQNSPHDLSFSNHCSIYRENIQTSLSALNDLDFVSKGKKVRGKLLDLELPAEVYIDSDEEDFLQATPPTALFSNKRARVLVEPDVKPSVASRSLNSVLERELPNFGDLNEPPEKLGLEESGGTTMMIKSSPEISQVGPTSSGKWVSPHLVQALPSNSEFSSVRGVKISGIQKVVNMKIDASQRCTPKSREASSLKNGQPEFEKSVFLSSKITIDLNSIDLNSVDVTNPESTPSSNLIFTKGEAMKTIQRCGMIDINLPFDDPTIYDAPCDKYSGQINLNLCSGQTRLEIDLEAPISPEVEERPPPRGDSEENQSDLGFDPLLEPAKIAAKTIVSLSSSQCKISDLQNCETSNNGNLEWFAGLISSLSIDVDNDLQTINKDSCSIDDYEAMTLELTEMKVEDYWCKTTVTSLSTENCSTLVSCQTRKGRARRSKKKDFQREVLPSLASLSRYEVSEDIQLIEGLMEAAGTPWQLSRTRRLRKPRVVKQQTTVVDSQELTAVMSLTSRVVMSWGKVKRRSRRQRSCGSPSVLSIPV